MAARHAGESALVGDKAQALKSWRQAEEAFAIADPDEDRLWTRLLNQDPFDTFRVATYLKVGKFDQAQKIAVGLLARLTPAEGKQAAVIRENIAAAHLARGSVTEAAQVAQVAQSGLAIVRETEFTMWLPKFEDIARGLMRFQRQPQVRAYLEALGAIRWDHQAERGFDFWVLRDPWGNEFCVLQPEFPEVLARQKP